MTALGSRAGAAADEQSLPARSRVTRHGILVGWAAVVAPFLIEALVILRASRQWLVGRTPDDAFYYLEIARRIDHGQGFSFDGIHATNGFHPLWQWILAGVGLGVGGQTAFVRADLLVCLVLTFAALALIIRVVWSWLGPGPALMGAVLVVHGRDAMTSFVDGMEGALSLLCLALVVTALVWYFEAPSTRRAALVGALSAVLVLARLDMVAVIWLVPAVMVWRARTWRPAGAWAVGGLIGVPWVVWFWIRYHHVLTTSAAVKQHMVDGVVAQQGGHFSGRYLQYLARVARSCAQSLIDLARDSPVRDVPVIGLVLSVVLFGLAAWGTVALVRRRGRPDPPIPDDPVRTAATCWTLATVAVLLVAKVLFDLVTATPWVNVWYLTPQRFAFPFAVGALAWVGARRAWARSEPQGIVAVVCLVLVALPLNGSQLATARSTHDDPTSWQGQLDQAVDWVVAHGPPGRYGASDAGVVGYRLDGLHPVVNLDGLVEDYAYAALAAQGASLHQEIADTRVDVLVNRLDDAELAALSCARVLWASPTRLGVGDATGAVDFGPVYVLDVRRCR